MRRWRGTRWSAFKTSIVYGVVATAWIVGSTRLVFSGDGLFGLSPATAELMKGLAFVAVSTAALWLVTHRSERSLRRSEATRRALLQRSLEVSEHQRSRVARDIQESTIQLLAASAMRLQHADAPDAATENGDALRLLRDGVDSLRRIVLELEAPDIPPADVPQLIDAYATHVLRSVGTQVDVEIELPTELDDATTTAVHRILIEALSNVALHAEADHVEVRVVAAGGEIRGHVVDDGKGIPAVPSTGPDHVGIDAMIDRATRREGTLSVLPQSSTGGTIVTFTLPLLPARPHERVAATSSLPSGRGARP